LVAASVPALFALLQSLVVHGFSRAATPLSSAVRDRVGSASGLFGANSSEVVQALFVLFFVVLLGLTVVGVWFRGPSMALSWPAV
jgi:hypothetical protein